MSMFGLGHWEVHNCNRRGDRNNDVTVVILKVVREPEEGFPNMGQFQWNLSNGAKGFFINYCPYCREKLMLEELSK